MEHSRILLRLFLLRHYRRKYLRYRLATLARKPALRRDCHCKQICRVEDCHWVALNFIEILV